MGGRPVWNLSAALLLMALVLAAVVVGGGAADAQQPHEVWIPLVPKDPTPTATVVPAVWNVHGCAAYPFQFFFSDFLAAAGIIRGALTTGLLNPFVTVRWLDAGGSQVAVWTGAAATSYLPPNTSMGFRLQDQIAGVPANWTRVTCEVGGTPANEPGYALTTSNVAAVGGSPRTVVGTVTNGTGTPASTWSVFAVLRAFDGTVIASQIEQRFDPLPANGSASFAVPMDRDVGGDFVVEAYASAGVVPPATPTPSATRTATPSPTPSGTPGTATPTGSPVLTTTATPTATPIPTTGWSVVPTVTLATLRTIALTSDDEGWAAGDGGTILRLKGGQWLTVTSPISGSPNALRSLAMADTELGWAVGDNGTLLSFRYNPTVLTQTWQDHSSYLASAVPPAAAQNLTAIAVFSRTYGLIGTSVGAVYQITGTVAVSGTPPLTTTQYLTQIVALPPVPGNPHVTGLAIVGLNRALATTSAGQNSGAFLWDGAAWTQTLSATSALSSATYAGGRVVVAGASGQIAQTFDGATWTSISVTGVSGDLFSVDLGTAGYGGAVGVSGLAVRFTPSGTFSSPISTTNTLYGDSAVSPARVWAVGANGTIAKYVDLTVVPSTPTATPTAIWQAPATVTPSVHLTGVAAAGHNLAFAVGVSGTIFQSLDGTYWITVASPTTQTWNAIAATSGGAVWAVGQNNSLGGYVGGNWSLAGTGVPTASTSIVGVALFDPNAGIAVGDVPDGPGCCIVRAPAGWSYQPLDTSRTTWNAVAMPQANLAWTVGYSTTLAKGAIGRWTSGSFSLISTPPVGHLYTVNALPTGLAFAGGEGGAILMYDPSIVDAWVTVPSPTGATIRSIALVSAGDGWALADGNVILRWQQGSWRLANVLFPLSGVGPLRSLAALPSGDVWVVGDNGAIFHRAPSGTVQQGSFLRPAGGW